MKKSIPMAPAMMLLSSDFLMGSTGMDGVFSGLDLSFRLRRVSPKQHLKAMLFFGKRQVGYPA
jgi:hypothetical protein